MTIHIATDGRFARQRTRLFGAVAPLAVLAIVGVLALAVTAKATSAGAAETATGTTESAQWVQRKIDFTYMGFTTHYSCDGLRDAVRQVLLQLGARRSDLKVHERGCTRPLGVPEPAPSVGGTFFVLEPAQSATEHSVEAAWQRVNVQVGRPGPDAAGQCELIDQVKQKIVPLFSTRGVKFSENCVPHQLTLSGSTLSVEVLKPAHRD